MNNQVLQDTIKLLPDHILSFDSLLETEDLFIVVQKLVIAILIGILIGLEREHAKPKDEKIFAGIRTFPLISVFGFLGAMLSSFTSYWVYSIIFFGFTGLVTTAYIFSAREGKRGGTSEISAILVFILGSLVFWNFIILAAIIAVVIALFLSLKLQLHTFVGKVSGEDIYATLKLAVITVIVLPLLPNETFGPFNVLNPRLIWLMIIFISSISFIGYILIKVLGKDRGIQVTGLMGGLVSSTAVAVSLSKKSKLNQSIAGNLGVGIILASTVMFPRVLFITAVLNVALVESLWLPVLILTLTGLSVSYFLSKKIEKSEEQILEMKNPFELKSALLFGLMFAIIIFVSKAAQVYFGESGVYLASMLAGITSVDAIVLSLAELSANSLSSEVAVAAILIALISNTIVKSIITIFMGAKELRKTAITGLGIITIVAAACLVFVLI
jgi:uncharacterized membrane protein (DUF4010 family)